MTISENETEFYNLPIVDFNTMDDWQGPEHAYRIRVDWETPTEKMSERLKAIADRPDAAQVQAIVIGAWMGDDSQADCSKLIDELVSFSSRLSGLRAIFLGDITYEENEISWIEQSDVRPLLKGFPGMEVLRVRGGNGLHVSHCRHERLKSLIVETGGLPRSVLREIFSCEFPNLEHLELWLGTDNYGWDGGPEDLQPLLAGKLFPKLSYLGLRNSDQIDQIAPVLPNSPIMSRIRVLDLSLGNMSDVGARTLMALSDGTSLEKLILSHHYITPEMIEQLSLRLPFEVIADDAMEPDDEWRSIYVSE